MLIMGIDPGLKGYIMLIDSECNISQYYPMPTYIKKIEKVKIKKGKKKGQMKEKAIIDIDIKKISEIIFNENPYYIFIEQQQPMITKDKKTGKLRTQGVATTGKIMKNYGFLIGLFEGINLLRQLKYKIFTSNKWKNYYKKFNDCDGSKESMIKIAQNLTNFHFIPEGKRVPDDNFAESYLIARYGALNLIY